jgi:hypothetical protein
MSARREPLLHPAFLVALGLLWLNDHAWKAAHPGLLTGKLSDVAGLFMLPVVVYAIAWRVGVRSRRLPDGVVLLGAAWFGLANLWGPAQLAFEYGFGILRWLPAALEALAVGLAPGSVHPVSLTRDPTDLLALAMIVPGLVLARRGLSRSRLAPASAVRHRRRPTCRPRPSSPSATSCSRSPISARRSPSIATASGSR